MFDALQSHYLDVAGFDRPGKWDNSHKIEYIIYNPDNNFLQFTDDGWACSSNFVIAGVAVISK